MSALNLNKKIKLLSIDDRQPFLKSALDSLCLNAEFKMSYLKNELTSTFIKSLNENLMNEILKHGFDLIDVYGLEKIAILNKTQHSGSYTLKMDSDISEHNFKHSENLLMQWNEFLNLTSLNEKIEYLLVLEHGDKLPAKYLGRQYVYQDVHIDRIIYNRPRIDKIISDNLCSPHIFPQQCPIILEELRGSEHFRLVDGYHRMSEFKAGEEKSLKAYVAQK